ncbi:MAG: alpha/beta hydrolase-fold protein [Planctomycetota bacterium]
MRTLTLAALVLLALLAPRAVAGDTVRLIAVDASGTFDNTPQADLPDLYIGSSINAWNPSATRSTAKRKRGDRAEWTFVLPRAFAERAVEFKFTLGSWETVETASDASNIPNRAVMFPASGQLPPESAGFAATPGAGTTPEASVPVGTLEIFTVESEHLGAVRTIRVWLPEQYAAHDNAAARYPVLYMHDAQNLFDDTTSFAGEWGVDETIDTLSRPADTQADTQAPIPPTIVVGIDNSGASRSHDYLPFPAGKRRPGMPGGGADAYATFLVDELIPLINTRYRTENAPQHTAIGGSSFGAVITLHTIMTRPGVFGAALVESPSLWVGDGKLIDAIRQHQGPWPERMFIAMGTLEYANPEQDAALLDLLDQAERALRAQGMGETRLKVVVEEGARHNELAWRSRLPGALRFLLAPHAHTEPAP